MRGPIIRCAIALVLLAVYYRTLLGTAAPAPAQFGEEAARRDIEASRVAFVAGRYAEALDATERLTKQFPTQAIYFDRLARIHHRLGRPQREARAWEGVFRTSPTPADACPMALESWPCAIWTSTSRRSLLRIPTRISKACRI